MSITTSAFPMLYSAQRYADIHSTCTKVKVGCAIVSGYDRVVYGANRSFPDCTKTGCRRKALYGNQASEHRLPSDCAAIHAEIDALCNYAYTVSEIGKYDTEVYITRYPCEACARALISLGVNEVIYGRQQAASEYTKQMFKDANISLVHISDWGDNK